MKTLLILSGLTIYFVGGFIWFQLCRVQWKRFEESNKLEPQKGWDYLHSSYEWGIFCWPLAVLLLCIEIPIKQYFENILNQKDERLRQEQEDKKELKRIEDDLLPKS